MNEKQLNAQEARHLLNHPMLKGAFEGVRNDLVSEIENAAFEDLRGQRQLVLSLQVLLAVKERIERHIVDNMMAQNQIEREI